MSISNTIADKNIRHEINLLRLVEHERRNMLKILRKLEKELIAKIQQYDPGGGETKRQQLARQKRLLADTRAIITKSYRSIANQQQTAVREVIALQAEVTAAVVKASVGFNLLSVGVSQARIEALASEQVILGAPAREWWSRQSQTLKTKFKDQVTLGVLQGESIQKITRRIRGSRESGYTDGIAFGMRNSAEALVRTSVNAAANTGRLAMYQANSDVIKGVQPVVTFDLRTSEICIARAGAAWDLEGNPLPQSTRKEQFIPLPWHFNERTTLAPILKSFKEIVGAKGSRLDKQLATLPKATKASMDGQIADSISFEKWLLGKTVKEQRQVLGATRQQLWSEGKLALKDLIGQTGRPLSIREIKEKL